MLALLIGYAAGRADRRRRVHASPAERTAAWLVVWGLITAASVPVGLVLLVPTVLVLAVQAHRSAGRPDDTADDTRAP